MIFKFLLTENRKRYEAVIKKGFTCTSAVLSSLLSHRRLPVKLRAEAPGYPVHKCSILADIELTVFEKIVLYYGVVSLKIAGNI